MSHNVWTLNIAFLYGYGRAGGSNWWGSSGRGQLEHGSSIQVSREDIGQTVALPYWDHVPADVAVIYAMTSAAPWLRDGLQGRERFVDDHDGDSLAIHAVKERGGSSGAQVGESGADKLGILSKSCGLNTESYFIPEVVRDGMWCLALYVGR